MIPRFMMRFGGCAVGTLAMLAVVVTVILGSWQFAVAALGLATAATCMWKMGDRRDEGEASFWIVRDARIVRLGLIALAGFGVGGLALATLG